jgi:hypothetical protein
MVATITMSGAYSHLPTAEHIMVKVAQLWSLRAKRKSSRGGNLRPSTRRCLSFRETVKKPAGPSPATNVLDDPTNSIPPVRLEQESPQSLR